MQSTTIFLISPSSSDISCPNEKSKQSREEQGDEDLEFTFVSREPYSSPISADKIFCKGKIKPFYQILNKDFQLEDAHKDHYHKDYVNSKMYASPSSMLLKRLSMKEWGQTSSTSSEGDELDNVQPGSYCVWTPKACKKSHSAASSRRWRLLRRSKSFSDRRTGSRGLVVREEERQENNSKGT